MHAIGVPLAIEPLHPCMPPTVPASIRNRRMTCATSCGPGGAGIAVDVYHVWWDPASRRKSNAPATSAYWDSISAIGWCLHRPAARCGMMGDGVIDIPSFAPGRSSRLPRLPRGGIFSSKTGGAATRRGARYLQEPSAVC
jgi:hypothetical protein